MTVKVARAHKSKIRQLIPSGKGQKSTVCCNNSCSCTFRTIIKSTIFVGISHGIPNGSRPGALKHTKIRENGTIVFFWNHSSARFIATYCNVSQSRARPSPGLGSWLLGPQLGFHNMNWDGQKMRRYTGG
jgi:hypothetical protein